MDAVSLMGAPPLEKVRSWLVRPVACVAAFSARYPDQAAAMTADFQESFRELLAHQARTVTETNVDELWRQF